MSEINAMNPNRDVSIAIIASRWNGEITKKLQQGALKRLKETGVDADNILTIWVPGSVEIPFMVQRCASSTLFDAVIAIGAVIRGETAHFDFVAKQVSDGCQQIALEHDVPVIFGVLTTENKEQAEARSGGSKGNLGEEWADAALSMIATTDVLDDIIEPLLASELEEFDLEDNELLGEDEEFDELQEAEH